MFVICLLASSYFSHKFRPFFFATVYTEDTKKNNLLYKKSCCFLLSTSYNESVSLKIGGVNFSPNKKNRNFSFFFPSNLNNRCGQLRWVSSSRSWCPFSLRCRTKGYLTFGTSWAPRPWWIKRWHGIADVKRPINIQSLKVAEKTLQNEGSG